MIAPIVDLVGRCGLVVGIANEDSIAAEFGHKGIRAHAISLGPIATRAASGIDRFDELLERAKEESPGTPMVTVQEAGNLVAFLASEAGARITGTVIAVDAGQRMMA